MSEKTTAPYLVRQSDGVYFVTTQPARIAKTVALDPDCRLFKIEEAGNAKTATLVAVVAKVSVPKVSPTELVSVSVDGMDAGVVLRVTKAERERREKAIADEHKANEDARKEAFEKSRAAATAAKLVRTTPVDKG